MESISTHFICSQTYRQTCDVLHVLAKQQKVQIGAVSDVNLAKILSESLIDQKINGTIF